MRNCKKKIIKLFLEQPKNLKCNLSDFTDSYVNDLNLNVSVKYFQLFSMKIRSHFRTSVHFRIFSNNTITCFSLYWSSWQSYNINPDRQLGILETINLYPLVPLYRLKIASILSFPQHWNCVIDTSFFGTLIWHIRIHNLILSN